ncbi:MAG: acyl carrier protein, partial [Kiritimatiellia bacterium]
MSEREPPIDGDALAGLLRATRESLQAFQATQAKTAEVHAEFLRSHAKASECFTTLFETHARLVELATGGAPGHARSAVFAPSPPTSPASSSRPGVRPISAPRAAPQELVLPDNSAPHVRASDDLPPELSASTLTAMIKEGVALPNPSSHGAPSAAAPSTIDPLQMVIDIVAVKTGYPPDLLSGGLDLETDLGVDSIKRVEIVGTLQDSLPSDVELDADHLATLRTLDDIADHVRGLLGESATAPNAPPSTAPIAASTIAPIAADVAAVDVAAVLIETVAQRTGYPSDLLQLDMDLETDLGVDSIKRVEIVSALQEALPSLPDIDSDELATLRTLAEIAAYVQALVPDQRAASQAVFAPLPLAPELPGRPARSPGTALNVRGIVFDTIASRTGFPSDLLGVAMDLEGDLGIDSIKRVEIMSALAEALPEVGELDGDVISGLRTIGEIVDHLKALAGGAPSAKVEQDVVGVPDDAPDIVGLLRREVVIGPAEAGEAITLGGACVVTRDHLGLAERLAAELRALGVDAGVIDPDWTSDS